MSTRMKNIIKEQIAFLNEAVDELKQKKMNAKNYLQKNMIEGQIKNKLTIIGYLNKELIPTIEN